MIFKVYGVKPATNYWKIYIFNMPIIAKFAF